MCSKVKVINNSFTLLVLLLLLIPFRIVAEDGYRLWLRYDRIADENKMKEYREDIKKVPGIGEKSFEQAAGFLRILDAPNSLDNSAVHPERYALVEKMAKAVNMPLEKIIGNVDLVRSIPKEKFISGDVGFATVEDILRELEKPGRDPREEFRYAHFSDEVKEMADLEPGMVLEGTVTNVTNFGAFIDIGIHQDGLVHISQIADCYVDDPRNFIKVGQIVKVKVLQLDVDLKRISLSLKNAS